MSGMGKVEQCQKLPLGHQGEGGGKGAWFNHQRGGHNAGGGIVRKKKKTPKPQKGLKKPQEKQGC